MLQDSEQSLNDNRVNNNLCKNYDAQTSNDLLKSDNESADDSSNDDYDDDSDENDLSVPVALPSFSNNVEKNLVSGDLWDDKKMRCQFISELSIFYTSQKNFTITTLKNSKHYKAIAITILTKYKGLRSKINSICDSENKIVMQYNKSHKQQKKLIQPWVTDYYKLLL